jgi:iron complex outermembrane receptor protein
MAMTLSRTVRALLHAASASAGAAAALLSAPVFAQEPAAADNGGLEEVVVTAQFRAPPLQDTPIAITAVTSDMLESRSQILITAL